MNLLSLLHRDYQFVTLYNEYSSWWELYMEHKKLEDKDHYKHLTKIDLETLRDNIKRLYESIDGALHENNHQE